MRDMEFVGLQDLTPCSTPTRQRPYRRRRPNQVARHHTHPGRRRDGDQYKGFLATHAPSTYKIPTAGDVPDHFKVDLWPEPNREDNVFGSKADG